MDNPPEFPLSQPSRLLALDYEKSKQEISPMVTAQLLRQGRNGALLVIGKSSNWRPEMSEPSTSGTTSPLQCTYSGLAVGYQMTD